MSAPRFAFAPFAPLAVGGSLEGARYLHINWRLAKQTWAPKSSRGSFFSAVAAAATIAAVALHRRAIGERHLALA